LEARNMLYILMSQPWFWIYLGFFLWVSSDLPIFYIFIRALKLIDETLMKLLSTLLIFLNSSEHVLCFALFFLFFPLNHAHILADINVLLQALICQIGCLEQPVLTCKAGWGFPWFVGWGCQEFLQKWAKESVVISKGEVKIASVSSS